MSNINGFLNDGYIWHFVKNTEDVFYSETWIFLLEINCSRQLDTSVLFAYIYRMNCSLWRLTSGGTLNFSTGVWMYDDNKWDYKIYGQILHSELFFRRIWPFSYVSSFYHLTSPDWLSCYAMSFLREEWCVFLGQTSYVSMDHCEGWFLTLGWIPSDRSFTNLSTCDVGINILPSFPLDFI